MNLTELHTYLKIATGAQAPSEHMTIRDALKHLDAIAAEPDLPKDLAHYLSRRSYVKALEWLDNPDMLHYP